MVDMHNILIIDDVVDKETQDVIEKTIFSPETQWTFGRTVFSHSDPALNEEARKYAMNFTKSLSRLHDNFSVNNLKFYIQPLETLDVKSILSSRIQLQLPVITDKLYGMPHVDGVRDFQYKAAVYYVNDSDGDTVFFKETTEDIHPDNITSELTIYKTVSPKKGRLVIFDGNVYHSSGKPKHDVRCIINYNFI
jgi:hypothetical protein